MNPSYIIVEEKNIIFNLDENKCNHDDKGYDVVSTKIEKVNDGIFKMFNKCSKCDKTIITIWKKVGRFYLNPN